MIKTWRPEGWETIWTNLDEKPHPPVFDRERYIYEAGATAMLEALKKTGIKAQIGMYGEDIIGKVTENGVYVFIPKELDGNSD